MQAEVITHKNFKRKIPLYSFIFNDDLQFFFNLFIIHIVKHASHNANTSSEHTKNTNSNINKAPIKITNNKKKTLPEKRK